MKQKSKNKNTFKKEFEVEDSKKFKFKWKKGHLIGKGAYGCVYQGLLDNGQIIAVKEIEIEESDDESTRQQYELVRQEVKILSELNHQNIVQ